MIKITKIQILRKRSSQKLQIEEQVDFHLKRKIKEKTQKKKIIIVSKKP